MKNNKKMKFKMSAGLVAALTLGAGSQVCVAAADEGRWQFTITPYFMGAAIDATAAVGPVVTDIDMSASDVLDLTEGGFMAMASARRGKLVLAFDGTYFKLGDDPSGSVAGPGGVASLNGTLDVSNSQYIYQPSIGYQVLDDKVLLDIYGGVRYTKLKVALDLNVTTTIPSFPDGGRTFRGEKSWTDVVVGTHVSVPLADAWKLHFMTDVGAGDDSDLSWQFMVAPAWQINDRFSTSLGYRMIHQEYADDDFNWEVDYSGVVIGLGIHF